MKKLLFLTFGLLYAQEFNATNGYDIRSSYIKHPTAYIPSMCYTKTHDKKQTYNLCYACHNVINRGNFNFSDEELQKSYAFPEAALKNPFSNIFKDYSKEVAKISERQIINYVNKSNYFDNNREIKIAKKLKNLPKEWDLDGDKKWNGYIPDCYFNFDSNGFDKDKKGNYTGWRAFAYLPFLGTFFPTNGSFDDVLIRLPKAFRVAKKDGRFDKDIYKLNLAILEALIKGKSIAINPTNENLYGVDLNQNGKLDMAKEVVFAWNLKEGKSMSYVGYAKELLEKGKIHIAPALYPVDTEFLHTVRYLGLKGKKVSFSPRMKEVRYAKKISWLSYSDLKNIGMSELKEKDTDPDKISFFRGDMERGLSNKRGWILQGFIEDRFGELRPQSKEETLSCIGCHHSLNVTKDTMFAFFRKLDSKKSFQKGWYHWSQKGLKDVAEFRYKDGTYEYSNYLKLNPGASEFRTNKEIEKLFYKNDKLKKDKIEILHSDVTQLLIPSYKRALNLDKAYLVRVKEQNFIDGKDAHIKPLKSIYKSVEQDRDTGLKIYKIRW